MPLGNAVIGQSGGPTAVINQSLVGVVETLQAAHKVDRILGARHAVAGMVNDDYIDLTHLDAAFLDRLANTPSSALGSSRDKPDAAYCQRIFESFAKQDVRYFFYAGGNDSSDTCRIIAEMAADSRATTLTAYHVPKTIDNDLPVNDHTPGFGSAAKFVAQAFMGDNLDNAALPGIKINVVMGRHAGFLTAASMLGRRPPEYGKDDGPHLVYVPEVDLRPKTSFIDHVERIYQKPRPVPHCRQRGHPRRRAATPWSPSCKDDCRKRRPRQRPTLRHRGARRPARRPGQGQARCPAEPEAPRPGRHLRLPATQLRRLRQPRRSAPRHASVGHQAVHHALTGEHPSGSIAIIRSPAPAPGSTTAPGSQAAPGDQDPATAYNIEYKPHRDQRRRRQDPPPRSRSYIVDNRDIHESLQGPTLAPIVGPLPTIETF